MSAATVDYLTTLPWFAVSDPGEPTPIFSTLMAEVGAIVPCWCGSQGAAPCVTRSGRKTADHTGRQR